MLAMAAVLVAVFALAVYQGWLKLPEKEAKPERYEVTEPGHEDKPFIETGEGERIVPEEKVPEVVFFNGTVAPDNVSIPLHYRVKFRNLENETYTLVIPDIGIEEAIPPGEVLEPSFYKQCECAFWLRELGTDRLNGTVSVS
jgi:hypothetical protein